MLKRVLTIFSIVVMCMTIGSARSVAQNKAMQWSTLIEDSEMSAIRGGQALPIKTFVPEIYFDPTNLRESFIVLEAEMSSAFFPVKQTTEDMIISMEMADNRGVVGEKSYGALRFLSDSIKRVGQRDFLMTGQVWVNGRREKVEFPFYARMGRNTDGERKMILTGDIPLKVKPFLDRNLSDPGVSRIIVRFRFSLIPKK